MLALGLLALTIAIVGAVVVHGRHHSTPPAAAPASAGPTETVPSWEPSTPSLPGDVTVSWAYLDSIDGSMKLGGDADPHPLDQLTIPGIAEDYLNRFGGDGPSLSPKDLAVLTSALAQNRAAGTELTQLAGDTDTVFARIIDACQLTNTTMPPQATALDIAHYGACLREGAIIDPDRAGWVLDQMRQTAGGIGDVRGNDGGQRLAQFNSTADAGGGKMRTGCLGIGAYWSAAVLVDWPAERGDLYGVAACAEVAKTQFPPDTQQAPDSPAPAENPSAVCPYETCRGTD